MGMTIIYLLRLHGLPDDGTKIKSIQVGSAAVVENECLGLLFREKFPEPKSSANTFLIGI
jgi:hypothetical protein